MNRKFIFAYRILLFLLAFVGVYLEISKYGWGMLMYYTVLSNLLVLLFMGYLVYLMAHTEDAWKSPKLLRVKGGVTMCIMITCVVYHFMLAPIATDFYRLENFLCHYIVPLAFLLDTLIFDRARQYRWFDPISWTSVPLVYMVFALFNGFVTKIPIPDAKDNPFPYFFLNVNKYGWGYVIKMCLIIFVAYLVGGYIFYAIKSITFAKKYKK
ncbi:Pr6Pr family membrane protein [Streptococcus massiliensis]|uniref:Membrane protein n=1 Tax=Streptococcus massiliensis TaxID=313439 RepID=A0A380KXP0_9STRE|nr:Pr6Pr family membrane protein [Streptococcus massiliensis]SUN75706.1 membrane protein [Streptococcus massiliensis]